MSIANTYGIDYQNTVYMYSSKTTGTSDSFRNTMKKSVVDDFKKKYPERARHVDKQLQAGKAFLKKNGLDSSLTESMTMEEYRTYIYALIDQIPYDATRPNDTSFISISDSGWEQMRNDPDYEAWIIGYLVEDRSVRNPFYGWGNDAGSIISEHFGASINEHHGKSFNKAAFKTDTSKNDNDEEDWWIKRHKRMKKLLQEQVERTIRKDAAQKAAARDEYARRQYLNSKRHQNILTSGTVQSQPQLTSGRNFQAMAAAAYTSVLDLFGTM